MLSFYCKIRSSGLEFKR